MDDKDQADFNIDVSEQPTKDENKDQALDVPKEKKRNTKKVVIQELDNEVIDMNKSEEQQQVEILELRSQAPSDAVSNLEEKKEERRKRREARKSKVDSGTLLDPNASPGQKDNDDAAS